MFIHTDVPQYQELESRNIRGQRWYTTPDNNKYPSVTTVLGYGEKPWLDQWRAALGDKKADKEQKRCAERGTAVHEMAEMYLNNAEDPTNGHKPEHYRLFNQLKFPLNRITNVRALEIPLYSDTLKIAGRVDCIAEYNSVLSVVDFKTSNNNKDSNMVYDYKLQATAYALMYHELFDVQIDNIAILMAVEKGLMPLVFTDTIDEYIEPLVKRINSFYKGRK